MKPVPLIMLGLFIFVFALCKKDNGSDVKAFVCDNLVNDPIDDSDVYYIAAPNAITPNGDGLNDRFAIFFNDIKTAHLTVYDNHENTAFQTEDLSHQWDPATEGIREGTYYYRIEAISNNDKRLGLCGELYLLQCFPKNDSSQYHFQSQWDGQKFNTVSPGEQYCP